MTKQFALHQHPIKFEYANCCQFKSFHFDSTAKDVTCGQVNATRSADEKQKTNQRPSRRIRSNRWRVPHSNRWVPTGEPPTGETPCSLQSFDTRRIFARGAPTFLMIHYCSKDLQNTKKTFSNFCSQGVNVVYKVLFEIFHAGFQI